MGVAGESEDEAVQLMEVEVEYLERLELQLRLIGGGGSGASFLPHEASAMPGSW